MRDIINFMEKFKESYNDYFKDNRLQKCKYGYTCDINQIYCYLNKIDIKKTEYYTFFKISKDFFDLKHKKILEVCCGKIPILSSIYKINKFDIHAIDNKILIDNYYNIPTYKIDLNKNICLSKYDIIIGLRPCNPTEHILDLCLKHNKNFMIYLCPCIHNNSNHKQISNYEEWIIYLRKKLNNYKNYQITFYTSDKLPDKCPIIIGKYLK